jgi:hypothetical protein
MKTDQGDATQAARAVHQGRSHEPRGPDAPVRLSQALWSLHRHVSRVRARAPHSRRGREATRMRRPTPSPDLTPLTFPQTPETEHLPRKQRIPDETRMVKAYARSAAGMDVELVSEIRSPATCLVSRPWRLRVHD